MREIQFRAWDKEKNEIYYTTNILQGQSEDDTWILMQYTGLKDKNGKEIYEGDILRTEGGDIGNVTWIGNHFGVGFSIIEDDAMVDYDDNWQEFEVIGNIYENPNLLNG